MTTRVVSHDKDMLNLITLLKERKQPFTVNILAGKKKTNPQNKLQRKWMNEAAEQLGTDTAEEFRGYCKLHFGVPILRAESDVFAAKYDAEIRPLPYELKKSLMMVPFDLAITRDMTSPQKRRYLDAVFAHFSDLGVALTVPEDKR